jgi:hypothetical protein
MEQEIDNVRAYGAKYGPNCGVTWDGVCYIPRTDLARKRTQKMCAEGRLESAIECLHLDIHGLR